MKENFKKIRKNKGFVIFYAVTLATIFLSIALSVASVALKEIKFGSSAKDTNNAFYAADAGVECALLYDKTGAYFVSGNYSINCNNNNNVTAIENPSKFWTFAISQLNSDKLGCVKITMDKTSGVPPLNTITANGYNSGGGILGVCNPSPTSAVERELTTSY